MEEKEKSVICWSLIGLLLLLCFISCLGIKSATPLITKGNPSTYWLKQLIFYVMSFTLMIIVFKISNDRIYSSMWIIYSILIILLVGLAIEHFLHTRLGIQIVPMAKYAGGATSWYKLPGFDLQPSEFMKIILVVVMADIVDKHNTKYLVHNLHNDCLLIGKILAVSMPPCILVYLQNDAGVTMIMLASVAFIIFISGIQAGWFIIGGIIIAAVLGVMVYIFLYEHDLFANLMGGDHKLGRFYGWIDPEGTYGDQGYQLFNALLSYGTAGLWGHGMETALINLPEAQTDFIFAVIALSFGFAGGGFTILVICILDILLIRIGFKSKNNRDKYFTAGIFGLLIFQQVWNIGMVLGLFPITGITLPFLSYGGSSLLSYMIAMGIFLDIEKQTKIIEGKKRY
ncbi:FtsW/RodA/SpoVE family cell cycle protein [Thomasclavelia cocleata]|uniref:Cell division protein FtsW, lipid II flippase n=1 Tax=Thomasclavelia cocleata TaxID=69824 RepID=A0A1I0G3Q1_9FIRM|nr:FtsW/RodA/SpoVE family cell cycle protein [Thomasclavelia cocleata]MCI9131628.1 FtsW/RodA/SpoVE family cell cycle protein [Thomasclavelia cocleata]MCI9630863.1 FtsW/RodA/SpoVE family cell cycle protein [Thomasclavelia cocleata]MCR1961589.1 FtsW/RodA/SpoVE family cell cycle protein [Thomasclavelia cocleata]NDO43132.1 FtsW/RodA/SpoVE family cell cycle protein [Thomasclavelia cocleata]PJN81481.1 FtsW/RodA/SpoVE family cell cycle protein [Thomasclavelia cocleata]